MAVYGININSKYNIILCKCLFLKICLINNVYCVFYMRSNILFYVGYENYDLLNIRSKTLLKLGLNENALFDADRVVQTKPKWSKVH